MTQPPYFHLPPLLVIIKNTDHHPRNDDLTQETFHSVRGSSIHNGEVAESLGEPHLRDTGRGEQRVVIHVVFHIERVVLAIVILDGVQETVVGGPHAPKLRLACAVDWLSL